MKTVKILATICAFAVWTSASALTFPLPTNGDDVVGSVYTTYAKNGDTIGSVGRRHDIGYYEMINANPHINARHHLYSNTKVVIPARFILPPGPRKGIVINLAELRLYYYPEGENIVITEPIGIGKEGRWQTPTGVTKITSKEKNPIWRPTMNVRREAARNGLILPKFYPPGPENPLGRHALRLTWHQYLIHGTNQPRMIGSRVSAGCIRMLPEDIERLYRKMPVGTQVSVVNEPFKAGWLNGRLYFEAHPPLEETEHMYRHNRQLRLRHVHEKLQQHPVAVQWGLARKYASRESGIPHIISAQ